jgi:ABC-2 type transport system ATP-binding protein
VGQTLRQAGIADIAGRRVDKLSGGQTQRVRFALAVAGESDLIVLDEPTTAMDVETRQAFWASMNAEVAGGRTLLFATHYLEEADQAADRILVVNKGRLLADGTPAEVRRLGRNKRYSIFSVAPPVVLYLVVAPQARNASAYGVGYAGTT